MHNKVSGFLQKAVLANNQIGAIRMYRATHVALVVESFRVLSTQRKQLQAKQIINDHQSH